MKPSNDVITSSGYGFVYSTAMHTLLYPFEVIKVLQHDPLCNKKCYQVAVDIFQKNGLKAFYHGLPSKLAEKSHHHLWRWPLILQLPFFLESHGCSEFQQQALTGGVLGFVDATLSTPLDARKIAGIYQLPKKVSWKGFPTYFSKRTVEWSTFLVAQNHFSKQQKQQENKKLNMQQTLVVALQTTTCVVIAKTPLDVVNTWNQTGKSIFFNLSYSEMLRRLFRGAPISFSTLLIYNICTTQFLSHMKKNLNRETSA